MSLLLHSISAHPVLHYPPNPPSSRLSSFSFSLLSTNTEMAEAEQPSRKRFREENEATEEEEEESRRRSCSYRHIISMLESEEEDPALEDLSSLISSLQQELSSSDDNDSSAADQPVQSSSNENHPTPSPPVSKEGSEGEVFEEMMTMRHLLQASDDELGIPTAENEEGRFEEEEDDVVRICNYDGFWEMEDEAANYYTLLQSELFM